MAVISDIEIRLRADIARLQNDMNGARRSVDGAMGGITQAAQQARNALGGIAAGIGLSQLAGLVDQYVKFTSQLKLATQSQREYNTAYADVKRIAAGSTQGLQETGILYARIANGTRELGVSQKQLSDVVETVNLSLLVSGATASEAASAQLQLSQAFASGTLRGEEFNSVNEAAPRLMKALADGIGVPVGALKKMAEEGLITSEIMANVLPRALVTLREEAKNIQTISGSFTLLKNSVMEFVGSTAQASGAVSAVASLLTALANNLHLVAGAMLTVVAVKLVNFLDMMVTRTMASVAANNALIASNIATAQATATASAQASLLANARLAEIRAATVGAASNIRLALTTNGLIPAQRAAAAAAATHSAAMLGLVTAQSAAAASTRALNAALALTGGPFGLIITVLGIAATAWGAYEYAQNKANENAASDTKTSAGEITESLSKVNAMLRERIALQNAGASGAVTGEGTGSQELRDTLRDINELKAKGASLDASDQIRLISLQGIYNGLNKEMEDNASLKRETEANGQIAKDVVTVRERLNGVNQQYIKDLGVLKSALDKGAISQVEYTQLVSKLASETYKSSDAYKGAKSNAEKAAKASQQHAEAYRDLIHSLQERVDVTALEAAGLRPLNDAEKAHLDLTNQITAGKLKLTESQQARARSLIDEAKANEVLAQSNKEYAELQETLAKAAKDLASERMSLIESARQEAVQNELAVKTFGMTEAAIIRLTASRLMDQEAQRLGRALTEEEIADLQRVIALKERSAQAVASRAELDAAKTFWSDIEKTARDTFVSIADGGKNAFQRLKDTAKNTFFDWLYQMTLKKWIINIGTTMSGVGGVSGIAQAATGAAGGGIGEAFSLASSAKSIYGALTGGATLAGGLGTGFLGSLAGGLNGAGIGSGLTSAIGLNIGNSIAGVVGSNVASGIATGLSGLAAAAPWVAGALAVYTIGKKAFGRGPKEYTGDQTLNGSLTGGGFSGMMEADWKKKGGWFSSSKYGTDRSPVDAAVSQSLGQAYNAIQTSSADFARVLGVNADSIMTRSQTIRIALGKDEAANQKAISDFFVSVADTIAREIIPNIDQFRMEGEAAATTLQRLTTNFAGIDVVLEAMDVTSQQAFGAVGVASIAARERLIAFAGGLDSLATQTAYFNDNFISEGERVAIAQRELGSQLAALGYSGLTTADQFRQAVQGLASSGALATEAGARTYAGLLALAPAFKTVTDYLKDINEAARQTLREQASGALDSLSRSVDAQKDQVSKAFTEMMDSLEMGIDGANDAIERTSDLSRTLRESRIRVDSESQLSASRQSSQSQIASAIAIARSSGVLPSVDDLRDALSTLNQDASGQFASLADYQREVALTNNQLSDLGGLTDEQLGIAERQLKALQDQQVAAEAANDLELMRLDGLVTSAQNQLSAIEGNRTATLSVAEAVYRVDATLRELNYNVNGGTYAAPPVFYAPPVQASTMQNNDEMLTEMRTMNSRMAAAEAGNQAMAQSMQQLASQFDRVSEGGNTLLVAQA